MKKKNRKIYIFLPDYPQYTTGGVMYGTIVYNYLKTHIRNIYILGKNRLTPVINKKNLFKIIAGFFYFVRLKKSSILLSTNTEYLYFSIPLFLTNWLKKIKLITTVHHLLSDEKPKKYRDNLEKYYTLKSDYFVAVSTITKLSLLNLGVDEKKIELIKPALELKSDDGIIKRKNYYSNNILCVGTFEERKGQVILIDALKKSGINNFTLNMVGRIVNQTYFEELNNKILQYGFESRVNIYHNISREKLKNLYEESFMFIFPTFWEGYGIVVTEALSHINLVISSRVPSVQEIMKENTEGIFFEPGNSDELAGLITHFFKHRDEAKKIALKGYERSKEFYGWDEVGEKFLKIIERF